MRQLRTVVRARNLALLHCFTPFASRGPPPLVIVSRAIFGAPQSLGGVGATLFLVSVVPSPSFSVTEPAAGATATTPG